MEPKSILVVDDDLDLVDLIRFRLKREGYRVFCANDGDEAMSKASEDLPDLVVLDVMMPKENGYRVSRFLKQKNPDIRVLLLTARVLHDSEREELFRSFSGADCVMYKPFEMAELVKQVAALLASDSAPAVP